LFGAAFLIAKASLTGVADAGDIVQTAIKVATAPIAALFNMTTPLFLRTAQLSPSSIHFFCTQLVQVDKISIDPRQSVRGRFRSNP
jgi:hypothetical protein